MRAQVGKLFVAAVVCTLASGAFINAVDAAVWEGPPPASIPPANNRPAIIWNSQDAGIQQAEASISVDGMLVVGNGDESLAFGENLIYGDTDATSVGNLLLLQTESADITKISVLGDIDSEGSIELGNPSRVFGAGQNLIYGNMNGASGGDLILIQVDSQDRFRVNKDGEAFFAEGVKAQGCFGATFIGRTTTGSTDNDGLYQPDEPTMDSYFEAHAACDDDYPGSHVCTVGEMLESYQCADATDPVMSGSLNGQYGWVHGGPPGYTAEANDCVGWSSNASSAYGRFWIFNNTTGGHATSTSCNVGDTIPFACCQ